MIEFEDGLLVPDEGTPEVSTLDVDIDMFDAYGVEMVAGRRIRRQRSRRGQRRHREPHVRAGVSAESRRTGHPIPLRRARARSSRARRHSRGIRSSASCATFRPSRRRLARTASPPSIIPRAGRSPSRHAVGAICRQHPRRLRRPLSTDRRRGRSGAAAAPGRAAVAVLQRGPRRSGATSPGASGW